MKKKNRSKDAATKQSNDSASGYKTPGGNMGAGKSGKENLGSEKPTEDETLGSEKPRRSRTSKSS